MNNNKKFWICGKHSVLEALKNTNRKISKVLVNDNSKTKQILEIKKNFKNILVADNHKISKVIKNNSINHQGYAAEIYENINLIDKKKFYKNCKNIIILDGVIDPRNIGSIIRSAVGFQVDAIIIKEREYKYDSIAMYKAASGAIEKINIFRYSNIKYAIDELINENFTIISLDSAANNIINEEIFSKKNVFIFGSEEKGISEKILNKSHHKVKINIHNLESLNVSNCVSSVLAIHQFVNKSIK